MIFSIDDFYHNKLEINSLNLEVNYVYLKKVPDL